MPDKYTIYRLSNILRNVKPVNESPLATNGLLAFDHSSADSIEEEIHAPSSLCPRRRISVRTS